jgi:hypothetical protein
LGDEIHELVITPNYRPLVVIIESRVRHILSAVCGYPKII